LKREPAGNRVHVGLQKMSDQTPLSPDPRHVKRMNGCSGQATFSAPHFCAETPRLRDAAQ